MTNYLKPEDTETVAIALKELVKEVVFVGGSACQYYAEEKAAPAFRPTDDVDCIVEIHTQKEYAALEKKLRSLGFSHDTTPGAPLCRKLFNNIKVDFMPSEEKVIGFSSQWFTEGIRNTIEVELPGKTRIRILKFPYFLATKFEAFFERGKGNFYSSPDFEDIVNVLAYRTSYQDLEESPSRLKKAFGEWAKNVISEKGLLTTIRAHLPQYEPMKISEKVFNVFKKFSSI